MEDIINFYKSELDSNDLATKVNSIHRVNIIITLIGIEESKKNIFPIFENLLKTGEDEVLFAMAEVLYSFSLHFKSKSIKLLEFLLEYEETVIRDKAFESISKIIFEMDKNSIIKEIIPLLNRLVQDDKKFMSKISASKIVVKVYEIIPIDLKDNFKNIILKLLNIDHSIIKRTLAGKLGDFCKVLTKEEIINDIIPYFKKLSIDDQDKVKILTIESLSMVGKKFSIEESKNYIIPILINFSSEKNWKIKIALAQNYYKFIESLGKEITEKSLLSIYNTLLLDSENEVRIETIRGLKRFISDIKLTNLDFIINYIQSLSEDNNNLVRTGFCEILVLIIKKMPSDKTKNKIIKHILILFNDSNIEVKLEIVKVLTPLAQHFRTDFEKIWNNIDKKVILNHLNWRVRSNFFNEIINLTEIYAGNLDNINKLFLPIISKFSDDKAEIVRDCYCQWLNKYGIKLVNHPKILNELLLNINKLTNINKCYKFKITGIKLIIILLPIIDKNNKESLLQILNKLLNDKTINIRYSVIKYLTDNLKYISKQINQDIINNIKNLLENDLDNETKYIAKIFLEIINN